MRDSGAQEFVDALLAAAEKHLSDGEKYNQAARLDAQVRVLMYALAAHLTEGRKCGGCCK